MEGWKDLASDGPVLATQTRALPQPQVLGVRTTSRVLELCLRGCEALGSSRTMLTPPRMAVLGWEAPLLRGPRFYSQLHCGTRCKAGS